MTSGSSPVRKSPHSFPIAEAVACAALGVDTN